MVLPYTGGPDYGVSRLLLGGGNPDPGYSTDRQLGYSMLDGLGRVLYHDDFANGLAHWTLVKNGTGLNPALDTTQGRVFNPPNGVKLDASVANGDASEMRALYYYARGQRLGLEGRFSLGAGCHCLDMQLFYAPSAALMYLGRLKLDTDVNQLQITTPGGTVVLQAFDDSLFVSPTYIGFKLVIDTSVGKYVRAVVGGQAVDLSAYSLQSFGFGNALLIDARLTAQRNNVATSAAPLWVGYATITVDEP